MPTNNGRYSGLPPPGYRPAAFMANRERKNVHELLEFHQWIFFLFVDFVKFVDVYCMIRQGQKNGVGGGEPDAFDPANKQQWPRSSSLLIRQEYLFACLVGIQTSIKNSTKNSNASNEQPERPYIE